MVHKMFLLAIVITGLCCLADSAQACGNSQLRGRRHPVASVCVRAVKAVRHVRHREAAKTAQTPSCCGKVCG